jgi:hypothetical protein
MEAGIALRVREALDSVAHHKAHRAGVEVGPDAFGSEFALDGEEILGNAVERLVPTEIGANCPLPFGPTRRNGRVSRSG